MGRESRSVQSRGTSGLSSTGASTMPSPPRSLRRRCVRMRIRPRRRRTGSRLEALNSILGIRGMRNGQGARHTGRRNDGSRSAADARPWMFIGRSRVLRRGANELLCQCIDVKARPLGRMRGGSESHSGWPGSSAASLHLDPGGFELTYSTMTRSRTEIVLCLACRQTPARNHETPTPPVRSP
jgi:hypothetical protein